MTIKLRTVSGVWYEIRRHVEGEEPEAAVAAIRSIVQHGGPLLAKQIGADGFAHEGEPHDLYLTPGAMIEAIQVFP